MGFDFINMSWDFSQDLEIRDAKDAAQKYMSSASKFHDRLATMETKLNRLTLMCQAMSELLEENNLLDNNVLAKRMEDLATTTVQQGIVCRSCKSLASSTSIRFKKCMLCGSEITAKNVIHGTV
jgi:N-glycosylase/DNA lyase